MEKVIRKLYHDPFVSRVFHTLVYCLKRELRNCDSVLDLGCGADSPVKYCSIKYSMGVDAYKPYLKESEKRQIHNEYLLGDITRVRFKPQSFDAVILIDVLEHIDKTAGERLLEKAEIWARKKVIVSTPNGFVAQKSLDGNPYQTHRCGWTVDEMARFGYRGFGMAGLKWLRRENVSEKVKEEGDLVATIRFKPRRLWLIISEFTQLVVYPLPKFAFEVLWVKNL